MTKETVWEFDENYFIKMLRIWYRKEIDLIIPLIILKCEVMKYCLIWIDKIRFYGIL